MQGQRAWRVGGVSEAAGEQQNCSLEKATGTPRELPCVKLSQRAQPDHGVQEQKLLVMSPVLQAPFEISL